MFSQNANNLQNQISNKNFNNLGEVINAAIPFLFGAAGLILLFYLVAGGFGMMTSRGDQKSAEAARGKITTAVTGFFIIILGYVLVQLVGLIFGVQQIQNTFGQ